MQNLKKLSFLLSSEERFRAILLLLMTLVMALIEMLGVASILPFIAVISNPQIIETNTILSTVYEIVTVLLWVNQFFQKLLVLLPEVLNL